MNYKQADRIEALKPTSVHAIPEGSWLAVRYDEKGTWIEVLDPEASNTLTFDFPPGA